MVSAGSLNTICNVEAGKGKPRKGTLKKLQDAIKAVEDKPVRHGPCLRRGRRPREDRGRPRKTTETGSIKLSNVDLELFNRILNMSEGEKIELLKKMM